MINYVTHHSLFISALFILNIWETTCRRSISPVVGPEEVQLCYLLGNLQVHYWLASQVSARLVGISHNSNKSSLHNLFDMVLIILTINLFACLYFVWSFHLYTPFFPPTNLSWMSVTTVMPEYTTATAPAARLPWHDGKTTRAMKNTFDEITSSSISVSFLPTFHLLNHTNISRWVWQYPFML